MTVSKQTRPVTKLDIDPRRLELATIQKFSPMLRMVDPESLHIDDAYQRNLTIKSTKLIRKIIATWSWSKFKPPIVTEYEDGRMFVLDGQHTAIAAATHPDIKLIPVFIVDKLEREDRAKAFIGHNVDRTVVNAVQLFKSRIESGDEDAISIDMALRNAKVTLTQNAQLTKGLATTSCLGRIEKIYDAYGMQALRKVLDVCVAAKLAPISEYYLDAVANLMYGKAYRGNYDTDGIALVIEHYPYAKLCADIEYEARVKGKQRRIIATNLIKQQYDLKFGT